MVNEEDFFLGGGGGGGQHFPLTCLRLLKRERGKHYAFRNKATTNNNNNNNKIKKKIQTQKDSIETLIYYDTDTQSAHYSGRNPLCQVTKQQQING